MRIMKEATTLVKFISVKQSEQLRRHCPRGERAIIWYESCLVTYSNTYFFDDIDTYNAIYEINASFVENHQLFDKKVQALLTKLSYIVPTSQLLYGHGK